MSAAERVAHFWSKINRTDVCWLWTGGTTKDGYGLVACGRYADGRSLNDYAHRIAWMLTHGKIPDDRYVLHTCDTPNCVRLDHLFLGTQADNMRDAQRKGRLFTGKRKTPKRSRAFLTEAERADVRRLHAAGVKVKDIAAQFNLSTWYVSKLGSGKPITSLEKARAYDAAHRKSA